MRRQKRDLHRAADYSKRPFRDNLPMNKTETKEFMRHQAQYSKDGRKKEKGVQSSNPAASFEPLELFCILAEHKPNNINIDECAALESWGRVARDFIVNQLPWFGLQSTAAAEAGDNSANSNSMQEEEAHTLVRESSTVTPEELMVQFVSTVCEHLISRGYSLGTLTLDAADHMRTQVKNINTLKETLKTERELHAKKIKDLEVRHREAIRYEVAEAISNAKQASLMLNSKDINEVRQENLSLQNRISDLRVEIMERQMTIDKLVTENADKEESIDTLQTAFAALQKVRDALKEDTRRELLSSSHQTDTQMIRLNATIAHQAEVLEGYNKELRESNASHQRHLDTIIAEHEALVQSLRDDAERLQKEKDAVAAAHLQLLEDHRDTTGRQTSILAHLARNSMSLVERQYQPSSIAFKTPPPKAPINRPTPHQLGNMVRAAMLRKNRKKESSAESVGPRASAVSFVASEQQSSPPHPRPRPPTA